MQLTPRTLAFAIGACLLGGVVLGAATTVMPSLGSATTTSRASLGDQAALGDSKVTFPLPTPTPTEIASLPSTPRSRVLAPTRAWTDPTASTPPSWSPTPPHPTASAATRMPTPPPGAVQQQSKAAPGRHATSQSSGRSIQNSRPALPAPSAAPLRGWVPPQLHVGSNDIASPTLSTGVQATATVMCSPRAACLMSGTVLDIDPIADRVTVTWHSPGNGQTRIWSTSKTLTAAGNS